MRIYLDIDGVLLANDKQKALHADDFLKHIIAEHDVHWLTTHVQGDTEWVKQYLARFLEPTTLAMIDRVQPTSWSEYKTEAIDFSTPFVWLDDEPIFEEFQELRRHGAHRSLRLVNLAAEPTQLLKLKHDLSYSPYYAHDDDEFYSRALAAAKLLGRASPQLFQDIFNVGFARAASAMDRLENEGYVDPAPLEAVRRMIVPPNAKAKSTHSIQK